MRPCTCCCFHAFCCFPPSVANERLEKSPSVQHSYESVYCLHRCCDGVCDFLELCLLILSSHDLYVLRSFILARYHAVHLRLRHGTPCPSQPASPSPVLCCYLLPLISEMCVSVFVDGTASGLILTFEAATL